MNKKLIYSRSDGETIKLIGRNSRLSLLQIEIVKEKIQAAFPGINVIVISRISKGDVMQNTLLHTIEGKDFFTQDIFDALTINEADIAVHSLKDMSSEHFFGSNKFAVVDRNDVRDVAIFNQDIEEKLRQGETIIVGTCSPRREEMATVFLKKALPQLNSEIKIEIKPIRGNVETRLRKLSNGEYDATILATAGLNRLLESQKDKSAIKELLADKKLMLLPLIECVPAPCQGAIVAEANPHNRKAIEILEKINEENLFADCFAEKKEAIKYGAGCIQKFGVTTIDTKHGKYQYAAGVDTEGTEFVKWNDFHDKEIAKANLFSTTDVMKDFFDYEWEKRKIKIERPVVFFANYKAVTGRSENSYFNGKKILASGTKTWFELAKLGYWVSASADALGFEFLLSSLKMPLFNLQKNDITILTHETAAERWKKKGYDAVSSYRLLLRKNEFIEQKISTADSIFWSSYSQFEFYRKYTKQGINHLCAGGETAELLIAASVSPIVFPTIKSFLQWRNYSIRSHNVA